MFSDIASPLFQIYCMLVAAFLVLKISRSRAIPSGSEPTRAPVPWTMWDVAVVFILYMILLFGCFQGLMTIRNTQFGGTDSYIAIAIGCQASVHIATVFYIFQVVFRTRKASARQLGLTSERFLRNAGTGIFYYIVCLPLIVIATVSVNEFLESGIGMQMTADPHFQLFCKWTGFRVGQQEIVTIWESTTSRPLILALAVFAVIIAPVSEEIFFRGFLQQALSTRTGRTWAMILSALIFAAVHMNLRYLVPLFILGFTLSYVFSRTRSLVPAIALHMTHNAITVAALFSRHAG